MSEKKSFKQWCSEHKKDILISAGIVTTGIVAGVAYHLIRKNVNHNDIQKAAKLISCGSEIDIDPNDISFMNIVSKDVPDLPLENIGVSRSNTEAPVKAFSDYLSKVIDNIGIDDIEAITVMYDIKS